MSTGSARGQQSTIDDSNAKLLSLISEMGFQPFLDDGYILSLQQIANPWYKSCGQRIVIAGYSVLSL